MSEHVVVRAMEGLGTGAYRIDWFGQIYRGTASGVAVVLSRWCVDPDTGGSGSGLKRPDLGGYPGRVSPHVSHRGYLGARQVHGSV
jgi:hypothetical protein